MAAAKTKYGARHDVDLGPSQLAELSREFLAIVEEHTGKVFPQDPLEQLESAVEAVFRFRAWQLNYESLDGAFSRLPETSPHGRVRFIDVIQPNPLPSTDDPAVLNPAPSNDERQLQHWRRSCSCS